MRQAIFDCPVAPLFGFLLRDHRAFALQRLAVFNQPLGRVGSPIQQHILDQFLQLRLDLLVHLEHPGIHDAHIETRRNGVIQERRVHRLAHAIVAAKTERNIRDAAAHLRVRQVRLDPSRRIDKVDRVVVVLFHACGNGQDIRIEDDVFGRKSDLVHKDLVGPLANANLVFETRGLPLLIKRHHHSGRAILQHRRRVLAKFRFAFFQRNRIHDALALQALQPGLQHGPIRRVDHERNLGDFGLAPQQLQKARHRRNAVDHALVHADVEHVGAVLHLLPRNAHGLFKLAVLHQPRKLRRTGHIGPLADHDEDSGLLRKWLRS